MVGITILYAIVSKRLRESMDWKTLPQNFPLRLKVAHRVILVGPLAKYCSLYSNVVSEAHCE